MTDITIPPEALEAAARAIAVAEWGDDKMWDPFIKRAEEAIAAALSAWPGMFPQVGYHGMEIILPLPKENTNV